MKKCKLCKRSRPLDAFHRCCRKGKYYYHPYCIDCQRDYDKKRYHANLIENRRKGREAYNRKYKVTHKVYWLRKRYNLSIEQFNELLKKQDGKCAICKRADSGRADKSNWHVDHKHGTTIVRGLLCNNCNAGLGYFKDSPDLLRTAAQYLESAVITAPAPAPENKA